MIRLLRNKVLVYVFSRYFSYFVQFVNSLLIAYVLGPYFLGIWGFILLVQQYLNFGNFGVDIALNVSLSRGDLAETKRQSQIVSGALVATFITSAFFLVTAFGLWVSGIALFPKYAFQRFLLPVVLIQCLSYFNVVLLNVCRTYSVYTPISIYQLLLQVLQLPLIFFFNDENLLWALLWAIMGGHAVALLIFSKFLPFPICLGASPAIVRELFRRGFSLVSYALSFYLILISTRTLVGYFYTVEEMGRFTFAVSIASALMVGLGSLEFVLFPKMINRLGKEKPGEQLLRTFSDVRFIYRATTFVLIAAGIVLYPLGLVFFEDYAGTARVFALVALTQVIISAGFGYTTLIISRQKETYLILHGLVALLINVVLSATARLTMNAGYQELPFFLLFAYAYYDYQVIRTGRKLLGLPAGAKEVMAELLPLKMLLPVGCLLWAAAGQQTAVAGVCALLVFAVLYAGRRETVVQYGRALIKKPGVVNI